MDKIGTIIVVGAGRMGQAMLRGWGKTAALKKTLVVVEPSAENAKSVFEECGVKAVASIAEVVLESLPKPVILVLAVKPQMLKEVLADYGSLKAHFAAVISIAAGKNIAFYEATFGASMPIYRTMPNLPAVVGRAYTYIVENAAAQTSGAAYAQGLFKLLGEIGVGAESRINAVTAITGSGPAYLYSFMESWIKAAEKLGFPRDEAEAMVRQTVAGSVELLHMLNQSELELARQVASPGGTTEAALHIFQKNNQLEALLADAVTEAVNRAKELE